MDLETIEATKAEIKLAHTYFSRINICPVEDELVNWILDYREDL